MRSSLFLRLALAAGAVLLAGCTSSEMAKFAVKGPFFQPANAIGVTRLPPTLHRVALLPIHGGADVPADTLAALDAVFASELMHVERFEVVPVARETMDRLFGALQVNSVDALPHEFLGTLARELGVDGVIFVDLTSFSAYPPLAMGVRAKLAETETAGILWSFDTLFSAANPAVANSARRHAAGVGAANPPVDFTRTSLQSPTRFGAYVASATFCTLPPR